MLAVQIDGKVIEEKFNEELKKRLDKIEHQKTFWDSKELMNRTCMSWNTIQDNFFHDKDFPKVKVGGKWYYPARETEDFLIRWLYARAN